MSSIYTLRRSGRGTAVQPAARGGDVDEVLFGLACYMHASSPKTIKSYMHA